MLECDLRSFLFCFDAQTNINVPMPYVQYYVMLGLCCNDLAIWISTLLIFVYYCGRCNRTLKIGALRGRRCPGYIMSIFVCQRRVLMCLRSVSCKVKKDVIIYRESILENPSFEDP